VVPASTPATIVLALALFAGSFVLREGDQNLIDGLEVLYVLPIALLAIRFGFRGGLAGALFGLMLIAVADLYDILRQRSGADHRGLSDPWRRVLAARHAPRCLRHEGHRAHA
jgi:hypothetical protein